MDCNDLIKLFEKVGGTLECNNNVCIIHNTNYKCNITKNNHIMIKNNFITWNYSIYYNTNITNKNNSFIVNKLNYNK
jgi:hypothetical protein